MASGSIGGFKFKSGALGVFYVNAKGVREERGKRLKNVEKTLERLNFEKILCLRQRKRAALVAKFERSPVNFKFVYSYLKTAVC